MTKKLHYLEQVRRQRDWTYQELADEIHRETGIRRDQDCWRRICLVETTRPTARTKHGLDLFLARFENGDAKKQRRAS